MKYTKRILSFLIAALLAFGVAIPAAHAAPDNSTQILTVGGDDSIFEYDYPFSTPNSIFCTDVTEAIILSNKFIPRRLKRQENSAK